MPEAENATHIEDDAPIFGASLQRKYIPETLTKKRKRSNSGTNRPSEPNKPLKSLLGRDTDGAGNDPFTVVGKKRPSSAKKLREMQPSETASALDNE